MDVQPQAPGTMVNTPPTQPTVVNHTPPANPTPQPVQQPSERYCPYCGVVLKDGQMNSQFCPKCGYNSSKPKEESGNEKKKKDYSTLIKIVTWIALAIIGCGMMWYMMDMMNSLL